MSTGNESRGALRRFTQLKRILTLAMVVKHRPASTLEDLVSEIEREGFPVCSRTMRRDLAVLIDLGMIERFRIGQRVTYDFANDFQEWLFFGSR